MGFGFGGGCDFNNRCNDRRDHDRDHHRKKKEKTIDR
jgi:hypothetical protein